MNVWRLAAGSAAVCLSTWIALAATAGGVGLQRSISKGAVTLFEEPLVPVVVGLVAFVLAYLSARLLRVSAPQVLVGVLVGDLIAGLVLAPIAIGELEPIHAPLVIAAVSVLGIQPAAAFGGAWLGAGRTRSRDLHTLGGN
jgi:FtsH-binding integral membrane protein